MSNKNRSAASVFAASSMTTEVINGVVLDGIADAWRQYPSEVPIPNASSSSRKLLRQVLDLLDQEGIIRVAAHSIGLTASGYQALEQASRTDPRLSAFLRGSLLAADEARNTFLMLAVLRAHLELRGTERQSAACAPRAL